jgi:hypothetical protein
MANRTLLRRLLAGRVVRRIFLTVFIGLLLAAGIQLRHWTWRKTRHVRFQHDLVNALYWGSETLAEAHRLAANSSSANSWPAFFRGYFALYDRVKRDAYEGDYHLDYPPLRLLAMSIWAKEVRREFPDIDDGHPKHVQPLLYANLVCELVSAVAIFFLVRLCVRRASGFGQWGLLRRIPAGHRPWICGLGAATVAWLEPSMILDAHGWPQWDVWIVPFFLFATLAALKNRWFLCGCLLAAGAMLKGQLLFVAPFFVFWPLWQKRWNRAARCCAGFAATTALTVSPWLLRNPEAWTSVALVGLTTAVVLFRQNVRYAGAWIAGAVAVAILLTGVFWRGTFSWLQIGFLYGSEHYPFLFISSCYNLPSLLDRLGWDLKEPLWSYEFGSRYIEVTLQWTLRSVYLAALAACAFGAARHARSRDPRLLMAIVTPWLVMFALLGQMHERYLIWGAVISAVALGVSARLSAIHFIISAASTAMIVHVMLLDRKLEPTLPAIDILNTIRPYASGLVLACVAVCLWNALSTRSSILHKDDEEWSKAPSLSVEPAPEGA